jgi:hypothetical protein
MKSRGRVIAMAVIVVAWFALALFSALRGAAWYIPLCYVACGVVMALVLYRTLSPPQSRPSPTAPGANGAGRARRSGNPAVRAQARDESDPRS